MTAGVPPPSPLISVVVTHREDDGCLQQAIDSVGNSLLPIETIVIDRPWRDDVDLAAARNRGLRDSGGQYVVFLDAEEKLAPGALELGAAQLEEHPEAAFVFGRCLPIEADGTPVPTEPRSRIARDHYRELLRRNYIWTSGMVMFRRDALRRAGGFNEVVAASADYDLYLHIARHHPVYDHGQVVAFCRRTPAPAQQNPARRLRETLEVLRSQRPFLEADEASLVAYGQGWTTWQEYYGLLVVDEIRAGVKKHEWLMALRNTATLCRYHPRGLWHHARRQMRLPHRFGGRAMPDLGIRS